MENLNEKASVSPYMKALDQSMVINNFSTNSQFSRDLGVELMKGSDISEHIEVLKKAMAGVVEFIEILKEKMVEKTA